jgi:glutathione S-transferase
MITLYYSPGAASMVVHWLLLELDAPHTLRKLDTAAGEHKQPAYLSINPAGLIPALTVDGTVLTEAAGICLYLAEAFPGPGLAPAAGSIDRGSYYRHMLYLANTLQPAFRAWFNPDEIAGPSNVDAVKACARARIEACWTQLDAQLAARGPYLLGDRLSAPDFMLTMLMRWSRNMPRTALAWPALARLAGLMKARPTWGELYKREGLTEWA